MADSHTDKPADPDLVGCEVFMKEVPTSEATSTEATEYFAHFCGLECYQKWKQKGLAGAAGVDTDAEPPA